MRKLLLEGGAVIQADPCQHFKDFASGGMFGCFDVSCVAGFLDKERNDFAAALHLECEGEFPAHLASTFRRLFLGNASCAKCGGQTAAINLRLFVQDCRDNRQVRYIVCNCGHPVWRLSEDVFYRVCMKIREANHSRTNARIRKESLKEAGGKHTKKDIQEILMLQNNRCIYCNAAFTERVRPTRDHLLPLDIGGTDWPLNIVMACGSCNSRRMTIPFRTYCRLLSPTQNRRIIKHLGRRIAAVAANSGSQESLIAFSPGIEAHDPWHSRYRLLLKRPVSRRYAALNRLLPRAVSLILKRANSERSQVSFSSTESHRS